MNKNNTEFFFKGEELKTCLSSLKEKGITEFTLQDESVLKNKEKLLRFLNSFQKKAPDILLVLPVQAEILDMEVCKACSRLFCTLEIDFNGEFRGDSYLFDRKFFSRRAKMLNTMGLVFGFEMKFALGCGDGIKLFFNRLDFAVSLYPNHIDFPQLEAEGILAKPVNSRTYSSQDINRSREVALACSIFYSYGRSVTWFLSVLAPLKISPSVFFEDFFQWQKYNHWNIWENYFELRENHRQLELMQLDFLKFKYEEKNKGQLFPVVKNIVQLNGAFSRCYAEGEESEVEMSYNPEEILSCSSLNIQSFFENSFMEISRIKVFCGKDGPEYRYC